MSDLAALQHDIGLWADETFPSHHDPDGRPNPRGPIHHLVDRKKGEVWELLRKFKAGKPFGEEVADCIILLLTIAYLAGYSAQAEIQVKMTRNRGREWGPPDSNGVCEHVREGAEA